jgi:hypothetical protein
MRQDEEIKEEVKVNKSNYADI